MRAILAAAFVALAASCGAPAEKTEPAAPAAEEKATSPMAGLVRVAGELTAISADSISVRGADGQVTTLPLAPEWLFVIGRPIAASDIKPGDFVATANVNNPDGTGRSVELRVFPPGVTLGEGSYGMPDGNTMTNGTVGEVANVTDGREMLVRFPGGERRITLPANVVVAGQRIGDKADLQPGWQVRVLARANEAGVVTAGYVYSGENGAAPPGQ